MMETHHIILCHETETQYRVRPNPDCPAQKGQPQGCSGIVLEWRNSEDEKWQGYFFIGPDKIDDVCSAMKALMEK